MTIYFDKTENFTKMRLKVNFSVLQAHGLESQIMSTNAYVHKLELANMTSSLGTLFINNLLHVNTYCLVLLLC